MSTSWLAPHYRLTLVIWLLIALSFPLDPVDFALGVALILLFGWIAWGRRRLEERLADRVAARVAVQYEEAFRDLRASQGRPR